MSSPRGRKDRRGASAVRAFFGSKDDGDIQPGSVRNVTLARGTDGSVGIRFKRPEGVTVGPIEVTSVLPNSAAERSGQLRAGYFFRAIDEHDVSNLDDKAVVELFRGAPSTTYTLSLCAGPAEWTRDVSKAFGDKQVSQAIAWATRSGRVQANAIAEFEVLLRQLGSVSLPHSKVHGSLHASSLMCCTALGASSILTMRL